MRTLTTDPALSLAVALALSLLFGAAAVRKLADLPAFVGTLAGYALLAPPVLPLAARLLAALEGLTALLLPFVATRRLAAAAAAALLLAYAAAMAAYLLRQRTPRRLRTPGRVDCGCGGDGRIGAAPIMRNVVLAVAAGLCALPPAVRPLGADDLFAVGVIVTALALAYLAFHRVMALLASWRDWDRAED